MSHKLTTSSKGFVMTLFLSTIFIEDFYEEERLTVKALTTKTTLVIFNNP